MADHTADEPDRSRFEAYLRESEERERLCIVCGDSYIPGRPDEETAHAEWHANYEFWLRATQPDPRLEAFDGDVRVDETSPQWLHAIVYGHCVGMLWDPGIAAPQWNKDRPADMADNERDLHAIILVEEKFTPVGAVAFSRFVREGKEPVWRMMFASIVEPWRRKGVMRRRWPRWRETYSDFELEEPLSEAMKAFVAKIGHPGGER